MAEREAAERELAGLLETRTGHRAAVALTAGRAGDIRVWLGVASVPGRAWRVLGWPDGRWETRLIEMPGEVVMGVQEKTRSLSATGS